MKNKYSKIVLDVLMTVILLLLMRINFVGIQWHEYLGIGIGILYLCHVGMNWSWVSGVARGWKRKTKQKAKGMLILDILLGIGYMATIVTGIGISQSILTFWTVENITTWSNWHHFIAFCSFILTAIHIGMHWKSLMRTFAKILGFTEEHPVRTFIARVLLAILVLL